MFIVVSSISQSRVFVVARRYVRVQIVIACQFDSRAGHSRPASHSYFRGGYPKYLLRYKQMPVRNTKTPLGCEQRLRGGRHHQLLPDCRTCRISMAPARCGSGDAEPPVGDGVQSLGDGIDSWLRPFRYAPKAQFGHRNPRSKQLLHCNRAEHGGALRTISVPICLCVRRVRVEISVPVGALSTAKANLIRCLMSK